MQYSYPMQRSDKSIRDTVRKAIHKSLFANNFWVNKSEAAEGWCKIKLKTQNISFMIFLFSRISFSFMSELKLLFYVSDNNAVYHSSGNSKKAAHISILSVIFVFNGDFQNDDRVLYFKRSINLRIYVIKVNSVKSCNLNFHVVFKNPNCFYGKNYFTALLQWRSYIFISTLIFTVEWFWSKF